MKKFITLVVILFVLGMTTSCSQTDELIPEIEQMEESVTNNPPSEEAEEEIEPNE